MSTPWRPIFLGLFLTVLVAGAVIVLSRSYLSVTWQGLLATANPPAGCPAVSFDTNRNFVVNGETYFPVGFWAFYSGPANGSWSNYGPSLNAVVDGPAIDSASSLLGRNLKLFAQVDGDASLVSSHDDNQAIVAWEVKHEPNSYGYSASTISSQASAMRAADNCGRPIFATPSLGGVAEGYLNQIRGAIDFAAVESGYLVPQFPIAEAGELFGEGASAMAAVGKPAVFVARVNGYQSARFRETYREPTIGELRAQIFDAIIRGAKGVFLWPFDKGTGSETLQSFEPDNSFYDVSASGSFYNSIRDLAGKIVERQEVFTAPVATGVSVSVNNSDVRCGLRSLTGDRLRLVCVNLAQDHSPYFDFGGGETVWRPRARVQTPAAESFPTDYASGNFLARELDPNSVSIQDISTGLTNQNKIITSVEIDFETVPSEATFTYALYADNSRDQAPDTRIYLSGATAISGTGPQSFPVPPTTLERTKNYYLLIKAGTPGIKIWEKDVRSGVRVQSGAGSVPLNETFEDLNTGDNASNVRLTLSGQNFASYCVEKNFGSCAPGTVASNIITDSFGEYAVHIYHFDPAETPEAPLDLLAPSVPTGLSASSIYHNRTTLSWQVASDAVGVVGYKLVRNNNQTFTVTGHTYTDNNLTPGTNYTYKVKAYDAAGNESGFSPSLTITTLTVAPPETPETPPPPVAPPAPTPPTSPSVNNTFSCTGTAVTLPPLVGPLSFGMKNNPQVRLLQQLLATDRTLYPEGIVSGYYGPLTREAVKRFQVRYGVLNPATADPSLVGFAGPTTRAKMNEILRGNQNCQNQNRPNADTIQLLLYLLWQLSTLTRH